MLRLQKYKSTYQSHRDQVVAHHQLSSTSQQQKWNMQEQNQRDPSQNVNIEVQKDPSPNKPAASQNASGFATLSVSASKKYEDVESTQTPVGQRSSENQEVKRQYNRDFLIQLSKHPLSMKRPDSLPNVEIILDYTACRPLSVELRTREIEDFTPGYLHSRKKYKVKYVSRKNLQGQEKGYWIPENREVKRQYNREFLIEMSKNPLSMKRPDSLPNVEIVLDHTAYRPLLHYVKSRAFLDFTPGYLQNPSKHKGKYEARNSLQGQEGSNMDDMSNTPIKREPLEICCVVAGEYVHFDAQLIRVELRNLFKSEVPDEEIFDWIEKHIGCKTNTKTFIRTLTTALIESLIERKYGNSYETVENFTRKLKKKAKLMHKYIKFEQDLEVACISALQTLCAQCQHPLGLLRKAFRALHDMEVLIDDSFFEWEKSDDSEDQPGKDVCLTSVKSFLDWLRNIGL